MRFHTRIQPVSHATDRPEEDKDQRVEHLANSLQKSFDICGRELKKEIAETLVPTVNHVKALYRVLDEKVDLSFGKGVITFNTACKEAEAMAIKEQDDLAHAYATTQVVQRLAWHLMLIISSSREKLKISSPS